MITDVGSVGAPLAILAWTVPRIVMSAGRHQVLTFELVFEGLSVVRFSVEVCLQHR